MHEKLVAEPRWRGLRFSRDRFPNAPPAVSMQLDDFASEERYADDLASQTYRIPKYRLQYLGQTLSLSRSGRYLLLPIVVAQEG